MAFHVYQQNKKTGITYVYEAISVWDKDKKQPRNKQVCIGKLDPVTGEFIPSKRLNKDQAAARDPKVTATAKIIGPSLILDKITTDLDINRLLKKSFPDHYEQMLTMAYYLVANGGALCHCETWSSTHSHPYEDILTGQRISEVIKTANEDRRQSFLGPWAKRTMENDYLCYDLTSVSSYSELNEYVRYGYNRDGESLKQINLAMLFGQISRLPVYYRRLPGSISDVATVHNLLQSFDFLELPKTHFVMDKGFYSQQNIDELLDARNNFTLAVPIRNKWLKDIIDQNRNKMYSPTGYRKIEDEVLYVHTELMSWGPNRRRCYVHVYFNAHTAADSFDGFTNDLLTYKAELESGNRVKEHEEFYNDFFIIRETPKRGRKVQYNDVAIEKHRNQYSGFFAILTNKIKEPVETLIVYRDKDPVEKCFDDMKNQLDMKRLRVHSADAMDGRLFIQFIALIYMSAIRNQLRQSNLSGRFTVRQALKELESITKVTYSGKYGSLITEVSKTQRQLFAAFGIQTPE